MAQVDEPMTLEDAGKMLREFQLNEWALDRRVTKTALRQQRQIVSEFLERLCRRDITSDELDHVLNSLKRGESK